MTCSLLSVSLASGDVRRDGRRINATSKCIPSESLSGHSGPFRMSWETQRTLFVFVLFGGGEAECSLQREGEARTKGRR